MIAINAPFKNIFKYKRLQFSNQKPRIIDQWNKIKDPNDSILQPFNVLQRWPNYNHKEKSIFSKWCWANRLSTCKRMKWDPYLPKLLCTKTNSKCIKPLKVKPETLKLLEENMEDILHDIGTGKDFLCGIMKGSLVAKAWNPGNPKGTVGALPVPRHQAPGTNCSPP